MVDLYDKYLSIFYKTSTLCSTCPFVFFNFHLGYRCRIIVKLTLLSENF